MSDLRARFVARFGADLAATVDRAAGHHTKVLPAPLVRGSDPFRFALVWAIGFECLTRQEFRAEHGITATWTDLSAWIRDEADLASYDGTMDLAGRGLGFFDDILSPHSKADVEAGLESAEDWMLASTPAGATA